MFDRLIVKIHEIRTGASQQRARFKYRTFGDIVREDIPELFEEIWLCKIRKEHRLKFGSNGYCVRCGQRP